MNKHSSIIISLVLGLSIFPSIVGGSESQDLPDNSPLIKALWPREQLAERNTSKIRDKPLNKTMAAKKVAEQIMELTDPFFYLYRLPKYLGDLGRMAEEEPEKRNTTEPQIAIPGYVKLLRLLIQHFFPPGIDASKLTNKKRMVGSVDEV